MDSFNMGSLGTANALDDFKMGDNSWELQLEPRALAWDWYQALMPTTFDHIDSAVGWHASLPQYEQDPHFQHMHRSQLYQPYQHLEQIHYSESLLRYQQAQQIQQDQAMYSQRYAIDPRLQYPNALTHSLPTGLPSPQLGTVGYQLALRNRIAANDLTGHYDVARFPPIFLHGVLTLPGSLAAVLGKESETAIISRMTPGYITGWQVVLDEDHREAHLTQVAESGSFAFGMIIFGQGGRARALIRKHYRLAKACTLEATCEVVRGVPRAVRGPTGPRRVFQKTDVRVHAFTLDEKYLSGDLPSAMRGWRMEEFLAGEYV